MKILAKNSSAYRDFQILEVVEAGMALRGTEIKSLRNQAPNLKEAFVEIRSTKGKVNVLEAWLVNCNIPHYIHGNIWNHEPTRDRKLLLHVYQIEKLYGEIIQKGMTVIPLKLYLKSGRAKVELGLARGKKLVDKRETLKRKAVDREMDRAIKRKN